MKTCNSCGEEKELDRFSTNGKNCRHPVCKECRSKLAREYRLKNVEDIRRAERDRYAKNPEVKNESYKRYYSKNSEKRKEDMRLRYEKKADEIKEKNKEYRKQNKEKVYCWNGTRRSALKSAVPIWADKTQIAEIYKNALSISDATGIKHHVDHIIPLKGKNVCGLHVPDNLQVITANDNLSKSNRLYAD